MATFKVGQRVRRVRHSSFEVPRVPIGAECKFNGYFNRPKGTIGADGKPYPLDTDAEVIYNNECYAVQSDNYEPVQYDGNQVISWDACIWNPNHIHEDRIAERLTDHAKILLKQTGDQP